MKADRRETAVASRWGFLLASRMGFVEYRISTDGIFFFMGVLFPAIGPNRYGTGHSSRRG